MARTSSSSSLSFFPAAFLVSACFKMLVTAFLDAWRLSMPLVLGSAATLVLAVARVESAFLEVLLGISLSCARGESLSMYVCAFMQTHGGLTVGGCMWQLSVSGATGSIGFAPRFWRSTARPSAGTPIHPEERVRRLCAGTGCPAVRTIDSTTPVIKISWPGHDILPDTQNPGSNVHPTQEITQCHRPCWFRVRAVQESSGANEFCCTTYHSAPANH